MYVIRQINLFGTWKVYRDPKFISVLRKEKKRTDDNFDNDGYIILVSIFYIMAIIRHI